MGPGPLVSRIDPLQIVHQVQHPVDLAFDDVGRGDLRPPADCAAGFPLRSDRGEMCDSGASIPRKLRWALRSCGDGAREVGHEEYRAPPAAEHRVRPA